MLTLDEENPKIWHKQAEEILKEWSEISASYRWLHYEAHKKYRRQNIAFTLPVIILSTIAGTANFSQGSFSSEDLKYVPLVIGSINLIAGLITTIAEFLKVSELSESHRSSSLAFGKLARNIKVELSLPWAERTSNDREFLKICRTEMDRLLEQSANIPDSIVIQYEKKFGSIGIYKPEIMEIHKVPIYRNEKEIKEEHVGNIVANAGLAFRNAAYNNEKKKQSITDRMDPVLSNMQNSINTASIDNGKYLEIEKGKGKGKEYEEIEGGKEYEELEEYKEVKEFEEVEEVEEQKLDIKIE